MKYRIFISSVQREFAKERKALASYIRMDRGRRGDFRVILKRPMSAPSVEKTMVNTGVESRVKSRVESRVKRPAKKLSSAEKIVAYLVSNPTASAHELSIAVNLTVKGIEKNLRALRESGRLRHVGPTKGGHWEVRE